MEYINIIIEELKSKIFNPECTAGEIVDFLRELDEKTLELVRKEVHVLLDENLVSSFSFELATHVALYIIGENLTKKEFAELANISTKTIKKIYSFKENIKLSSILKILSVTGGKITLYPKTDEEVNE